MIAAGQVNPHHQDLVTPAAFTILQSLRLDFGPSSPAHP
jgi:hypothetical protein